mmetsp:Transcript_38588/g.70169  ORF Transcript_38588/g.70169 Transcript_38588/m.70169 type:complete len:232 (+) Transcript_38588:51-746(+)
MAWAPGQSYNVGPGGPGGPAPPPGWGQQMPAMQMGGPPVPEGMQYGQPQPPQPATSDNDFETSVECLQPLMLFFCFVPSFYAFMFMYLADINIVPKTVKEEEMEAGTQMCGMMGIVALVYAMVLTTAVTHKSGKACRVMIVVRVVLGVLWLFMAIAVAVASSDKGMKLAMVYVALGLLALPEAYLLYLWTLALLKEEVERRAANQMDPNWSGQPGQAPPWNNAPPQGGYWG